MIKYFQSFVIILNVLSTIIVKYIFGNASIFGLIEKIILNQNFFLIVL